MPNLNLNLNKPLRFAIAVILFLAALWLVPHTPDSVVLFLQRLTGHVVILLSHSFGLTATYDASSQLFSVDGFSMVLASECVALHYFAILWLTILLMPGQSWRRKAISLPCCTAALFLCNVLRLIFLGLIGHHYPDSFDAVHDFVWQVAFALLTFALCFAWTKRPGARRVSQGGMLLLSVGCAGGFALLLNAGKLYYITAITWAADKGLMLLQSNLNWSERWWAVTQKHFIMIRVQGSQILYHLPNKEFTVGFWQDFLGMAIFLGLCSASLILAMLRKSSETSLLRMLLGVGGGASLLLLIQVGSLVTLGHLLTTQVDTTLAKNFLWLLRGVSVLLPVLFWWLIWKRPQGKRPEGKRPEGKRPEGKRAFKEKFV